MILTPTEEQIIIPDGASYDYLTDVCADPSGETVVFNAPFQDTDADGLNSKTNSGAIYVRKGDVTQKITPKETQRHASIAVTNDLLHSRTLDNVAWTNDLDTLTQNQTGYDGAPNKAWFLEDTNASATRFLYQTITIPNDSNTHGASVLIKKDSTTSRFPEVQLNLTGGSTEVYRNTQLNTSTGDYRQRNVTGSGDYSVEAVTYNSTEYWLLKMYAVNNTSGNTTLEFWVFAAASNDWSSSSLIAAAQGSIIVDGCLVELDTSVLTDYSVETTTVSVTETQSQVFGHHVDISSDGRVIVASARGEEFNTGVFYILTKPNGDSAYKISRRVKPSWVTPGDRFGFSIGVGYHEASGKYIIAAGAPFANDTNAGQGVAYAYIYDYDTNTVTEGGKLTAGSGATNLNHGYSIEVANDASFILVAARLSTLAGKVELYEPHSTLYWSANRVSSWAATTGGANDYFGIGYSSDPTTFTYRPMGISPDGTWYAIGAQGEETVRVYSADQTLQTTYSAPTAGVQFGSSVSIGEDFIAIGEQEYDISSNEGAYQYASYTTSWGSLTRKTADTPTSASFYGYDVFVTDNHVFIVASDYNNGAVLDVGAVYKDLYRSGLQVSATDTEVQKPVDYWIPVDREDP